MRFPRCFCACLLAMVPGFCADASLSFDHVVLLVMENESDTAIIGNPDAPTINGLAAQGALFTNSFAIEHPSQPNYLDLFSGSNQGITHNGVPPEVFTTPNLGAELFAKGRTFIGYAESMPEVGFTGEESYPYARRHNPWVNWQDAIENGIPASSNRPFSDFPGDFALLPTVSFVVPNVLSDMHDESIAYGDAWLAANIDSYVQWATLHNSLLILTWDEDDFEGENKIPTIFVGANVIAGQYDMYIDHFSVLRTIEDFYGLGHAGAAATATPITGVFVVPEPSEWGVMGIALLAFAVWRRRGVMAMKGSHGDTKITKE